MTIILFLVDTSASMSQRTYLGARPTLLDVAKDAIEKFLKVRQRDPNSRLDRYMLLTFEDPPNNIKAGWKEHHNVFMNELKNLTAAGMTTLGTSLKHAFDLLNLNRMQTGIDTYGQGRCPFYLEPSIIIVITDGGKMSSGSGVTEELSLPMHSSVPGSELTKEPFRWDQRLFSLVLRLTGTLPPENGNNGKCEIVPDISPIEDMCEVTGGASYMVSSQRSLMACLENIVSKIQGGVVIHFERVGDDPVTYPQGQDEDSRGGMGDAEASNSSSNMSLPEDQKDRNRGWQECRKLIYVPRSAAKGGYSIGHWPLPESFWPDASSPSLAARTAHPEVKFMTIDAHPLVMENLPFDKYELEPCALTRVILSRKSPNTAWQCFVANSNRSSDLGYPFGYLKASSTLNCVNLFVLPYNYPVLLPLLEELKAHGMKPPVRGEWRSSWDKYLVTVPPYYAAPLKRALQRMGAPQSLVPDNLENYLSYSVLTHLKRLKNQAKAEFDKVVSSVGSYGAKVSIVPESIKLSANMSVQGRSSTQVSSKKLSDMVLSCNNASHQRINCIQKELTDYPNFVLRVKDRSQGLKIQSFRNPYDISRRELIDQIHRMRVNFFLPANLIKYQDDDQLHSLPVAQMGNYQDYLKRMPTPLRELESTPVRQHMFGNPFKIDKKGVQIVDETDIDLVGNGNGNGNGVNGLTNTNVAKNNKRPAEGQLSQPGRKLRRPGPLPKDFTISRGSSTSPASSPRPPSPSPSNSSDISTDSMDVDMDTTDQFIQALRSQREGPVTPTGSEDSDLNLTPTIVQPIPKRPSGHKKGKEAPGADVNVMLDSSSDQFLPDKDSKLNGRNQPAYNEKKEGSVVPSKGLGLMMNGLSDVKDSNRYVNGQFRAILTEEEKRIRRELFSLAKRPGRNFSDLMAEIDKIKSESFQEFVIREVRKEAQRFKRRFLIDVLTARYPNILS